MPIQDKEINELVAEQTDLFINEAPIEKKVDVLKRIQKRQKKLMRYRND